MTPKSRKFMAATLTVVALLGSACGGEDEDGASESFEIQAFDFRFDPTTITVSPGAGVQIDFSNVGEVAHSVTIPDLDFEVSTEGGQDASDTFVAPDEPGSIDFFCKFHPDEMNGTISVAGGDQPIEEDVDVDDDDDDADVEVDVEETEDASSSGDADVEY